MDERRETQRRNELIAEKFRRIEEEVASVSTVRELFETLLWKLEEEFSIPFVWLSLVDEPEAAWLVRALQTSDIIRHRLNLVGRQELLHLLGGQTAPLLANEALKPYYRLLPEQNKYLIRSLAVAPLATQAGLVGSINHGDPSALRYRPGMDTTLLGQMAAKVGERLEALAPPAAARG
jgi:uncharacterized protein YigA (DUF484 family)